jgi:hypothetical protein
MLVCLGAVAVNITWVLISMVSSCLFLLVIASVACLCFDVLVHLYAETARMVCLDCLRSLRAFLVVGLLLPGSAF